MTGSSRWAFWSVLFVASTSFSDHWPQWRGPSGTGVSAETGLPDSWNGAAGALWRLELPGPGGSTPVVWGDRIYLTSADADNLVLIAADINGKLLWKEKITGGNRAVRGDEGNLASPSPATDGENVWAMFGDGILTCRDRDGKEIWTVDLQERYGKYEIQFGMTSTPVLDGDRLYLQCMTTGSAYLACLDKHTGKEIWRSPRPSDATAECEHSYASPFLYRDNNREMLLIHGADYVTGHSLADGKEIFRCGGLNGVGLQYNPTLRFVSSPVGAEGLIVVPSAKKGPVLGLHPDAQGDITKGGAGHAWRLPRNTPDVPSPLIHGGLVYLCSEEGVLTCLDAGNGEIVYTERIQPDRHRASPVYADGKVYLTSRKGIVSVVKAGRKFQLLAKNDMADEMSSSPAISGSRLYLRTFTALFAVGK